MACYGRRRMVKIYLQRRMKNNMEDNGKLAEKIATRNNAPTSLSVDSQLKGWWVKNSKQLRSLAGSEAEAKKMFVTAINVLSRTPKLVECSFDSLAQCILTSAELKLFPGALQECAFVPMKINGRMEAQLWPMYQGLVKLAFNSGQVRSITAQVVYEHDEFDFELGSNQFLRHKPFLEYEDTRARGERKCAYCCIKLASGETQILVLSMKFIWGIRDRAPSRNNPVGWGSSDPDRIDQYIKKTVLKQALKLVPKSTELARAIEVDNQSETQEQEAKPVLDFSGAISLAVEDVAPTKEVPDMVAADIVG